ncbi:helix-turn-helix domain-containing protein [Streptomyces sp. NPDC020607]|uniref:helix-turn-helix domain-containing protein n=1 Tax=Streptomyces sp. NPDC020607 TaxID=3365082 RepID=UPI0037B95B2E
MPSAPPDWVLTRRRAVGARIRSARQQANLTQERVALMIGIDRPSIVRIEQGQQAPTLDTLIRIADAIGVPLRDLV